MKSSSSNSKSSSNKMNNQKKSGISIEEAARKIHIPSSLQSHSMETSSDSEDEDNPVRKVQVTLAFAAALKEAVPNDINQHLLNSYVSNQLDKYFVHILTKGNSKMMESYQTFLYDSGLTSKKLSINHTVPVYFHWEKNIRNHHLTTIAASNGNLQMLRWLKVKQCDRFTVKTSIAAAASGSILTLHFLGHELKPQCPFSEKSITIAAGVGDIDVVQYLCEKARFADGPLGNQCMMMVDGGRALRAASRYGHLDVLKYLSKRTNELGMYLPLCM